MSVPYGKDPAVQALLAWEVEAAKAVNAGKLLTPSFAALMTPAFAKQMNVVIGDDVGRYYPGPWPSRIMSVRTPGPGERIVYTCDVLEGFAQDPKTHKPAKPLDISPGEQDLLLIKGKWVMGSSSDGHGFSCQGVHVAMTKW